MLTGLVAYPSALDAVSAVIETTLKQLHQENVNPELHSWKELDTAGNVIGSTVLEQIDAGDALVADVTALNFNVVYEIGFAIGREKRILLIKYGRLPDDVDVKRVGVFDTLGYRLYTGASTLRPLLDEFDGSDSRLRFDVEQTNQAAPVYLVLPEVKGDFETRLIARVKKARLFYRSFDPEESGRMSAADAIEDVASSHGVVVPLLKTEYKEARVHNLRAAFVAGLAQGMDKPLLLIQDGDDPVPADYRDLVKRVGNLNQINQHVAEFAPEVTARLQAVLSVDVPEPATLLARLNLGAASAENEFRELRNYYLQTDEFAQASRGEVQLVLGRKGAGKTALFFQLRDRLRQDRRVVVLDLKPEGFQLLKFKEQVLDYLEEGTRAHTVTIFWEYLLLLEVCHKLLQQDARLHLRNHELYEPYRRLADSYGSDEYVAEGDFAERMLKLTQRISDDFAAHRESHATLHERLSSGRITGLLYKHDVVALQAQLIEYLVHKEELWILFDNLDKGWPAHGIGPDDVLTLRCLLDAMRKMQRGFSRAGIDAKGIVFIRNDVYEHLVAASADRGKLGYVLLDWTDPELLLELLRRRFVSSGVLASGMAFADIWRQICVSHVDGEESAHYMLERCLMRPRWLIEMVRGCRTHAVNLGHQMIEVEDIKEGESQYSTKLVDDIGYELQDVCPEASDVLYEMLEVPKEFPDAKMQEILEGASDDESTRQRLLELLLWYGIIGFRRSADAPTFIYDVGYDMKRLSALIGKRKARGLVYVVNPAFWKGLEIIN